MEQTRRLSDVAAEKVLELIQQRGIPPGGRLPAERSLAHTLGVSRSALREAIQKLASHGILASRAGAGTYVQTEALHWPQQAMAPLATLMQADQDYRYDVLEARCTLESGTAAFAAQRATDKDKANIQRCFDQMIDYQQRGDSAMASRADAQFHLAIAEASHNLVLLQIMRGLFELVLSTVAESRRVMFVHDGHPGVHEQLTQQHHLLMRRILEGDPEGARRAVTDHLAFVRLKLKQMDEDAARRERATRLPNLEVQT